VRDLLTGEDKIMDIEFVRSDKNVSDTFTDNNTNDTFWKLTSRYMTEDGRLDAQNTLLKHQSSTDLLHRV
jgi:hypothetical protein